jgi:hypothetical protein
VRWWRGLSLDGSSHILNNPPREIEVMSRYRLQYCRFLQALNVVKVVLKKG